MSKSKISLPLIYLASACLFLPLNGKAHAENLNLSSHELKTITVAQRRFRRLRFKLPERGVPGARIGGATRSTGESITAIVPSKKLGLTASKSPMIFVFVPENQFSSANLTIIDKNGNEVYQASFIPPQEEGIVRIKLPATLELETENPYRWQVQLVSCNENPAMSLKNRTFGWVEKVDLEGEISTTQASDPEAKWETLNTLAEAGIWHDTLEYLAVLQLENPDDPEIKEEWTQLLESVGLEKIADSNIFPEVIEVQ